MGCKVAFNGNQLDYPAPLCPRGHYNLELVNRPLQAFEGSIADLKKQLKSDTAVRISCLASCEEAILAAKLGANNVAAIGYAPDLEAVKAEKWGPRPERAKIESIGSEDCLLIIGDLLARSAVMAKKINQVKYSKRGNQIIVIDPNTTHTSWFATLHLKNQPGTEALVLAELLEAGDQSDEKIKTASQILAASKSLTIIFVPSENIQHNDLVLYLVKLLADKLLQKYICFYMYGNTLGVSTILDNLAPDHETLSPKPSNSLILDEHLNLPLATQFEEAGTYVLADARIEQTTAMLPKAGTYSIKDILIALLGQNIDEDELKQELAFILQKGIPAISVNKQEKLDQARSIIAKGPAKPANITHFGDNQLVKDLFWYKVNNG
jgi:hypothetical protein